MEGLNVNDPIAYGDQLPETDWARTAGFHEDEDEVQLPHQLEGEVVKGKAGDFYTYTWEVAGVVYSQSVYPVIQEEPEWLKEDTTKGKEAKWDLFLALNLYNKDDLPKNMENLEERLECKKRLTAENKNRLLKPVIQGGTVNRNGISVRDSAADPDGEKGEKPISSKYRVQYSIVWDRKKVSDIGGAKKIDSGVGSFNGTINPRINKDFLVKDGRYFYIVDGNEISFDLPLTSEELIDRVEEGEKPPFQEKEKNGGGDDNSAQKPHEEKTGMPLLNNGGGDTPPHSESHGFRNGIISGVVATGVAVGVDYKWGSKASAWVTQNFKNWEERLAQERAQGKESSSFSLKGIPKYMSGETAGTLARWTLRISSFVGSGLVSYMVLTLLKI
jgi:hypothetical protein